MKFLPKAYKNIDFDSSQATMDAREAFRLKKSLMDIYKEQYEEMMWAKEKYLSSGKRILELGSGGGFIKDLYPEIITSEVIQIPEVDMVVDAMKLPFANEELDAIFAVHVMHHIPDVELFFKEARRTLKPGGGVVFVEPYWGPFASFVYKLMHPEPFDKKAVKWQLEGSGRMTDSNQALSYILLKRDKEKFQKMFPEFELVYQRPFGFIRYIMTGGISLKKKLPNFMFPMLKFFEKIISPLMPILALHHIFILRKRL